MYVVFILLTSSPCEDSYTIIDYWALDYLHVNRKLFNEGFSKPEKICKNYWLDLLQVVFTKEGIITDEYS